MPLCCNSPTPSPPPSTLPETPQRKNGKRKPLPTLQHVPRLISIPGGSIIVRIPRTARSRRLRAAVSHRSRRAVVPSAGPRRRRPGRGGRRGVCAPAARPGRRGRGVQRTWGRRIEGARRGSVEGCAGGGSSQATRGGRVIRGRRRAPGIAAGAWCRCRYAISWGL